MLAPLRRAFTGQIEASPFARRCYAGAAGIYAQRPRAVAFPASARDVQVAVLFCRRRGLPLTARGAGSGMAGNNVGRGLILDVTRHLNLVLGYDSDAGRVRVQPGVTYDGLNAALRPHGRFLPPNPSSGAFCTIGGMVASNASGMRSVKYGPIAPWVTAIRGVWGTGEAFELRRAGDDPGDGPSGRGSDRVLFRLEDLFRAGVPPPPAWLSRVVKNSAGLRVWSAWDGRTLDGVELLVSSEGTLAVFTEIELRTAPTPGERALVVAGFRSLDGLARAVERVLPLGPSGVEFFDGTFLDALRAGSAAARRAIPEGAGAVLFVETEGFGAGDATEAARTAVETIAGLALPGVRMAPDAESADRLWHLRKEASPSLARRYPGLVTHQFVEDCAAPPGSLSDLLRGLRAIFEDEGVPVVLFGHAGESHVHANPLFDPADPRLEERIERVAERVSRLVDEVGGTLSGEHGDGLARAAFAHRRFGPAADFFADVRAVCDPGGILNPGKILPAPDWRTGRDLRHPWERRLLEARARRRRRVSQVPGEVENGGGLGPSPGDRPASGPRAAGGTFTSRAAG